MERQPARRQRCAASTRRARSVNDREVELGVRWLGDKPREDREVPPKLLRR